MDVDELKAWRTATEHAAAAVVAEFEDTYGFPPGDNVVEDPDKGGAARLAAIGAEIPVDLVQLYTVIGGVSLPDVGNGIFVHDPGLVADAYTAQQLRHVTGRHQADVVVFASDGGGTLFALASPTGSPVYRLPAGKVIAGTYETNDPDFDIVATDLAGFLARLRHAAQSFAETGAIIDL